LLGYWSFWLCRMITIVTYSLSHCRFLWRQMHLRRHRPVQCIPPWSTNTTEVWFEKIWGVLQVCYWCNVIVKEQQIISCECVEIARKLGLRIKCHQTWCQCGFEKKLYCQGRGWTHDTVPPSLLLWSNDQTSKPYQTIVSKNY